jgi:hypothetical protein
VCGGGVHPTRREGVGTLAYFPLRRATENEIRQAQQASQEVRGDRPTRVRRRIPGE